MKTGRLLIAISLALVVPTVPLPMEGNNLAAKSIHKEFMEAWGDRDTRYFKQRDELDAKTRDVVERFFVAVNEGSPDAGPLAEEMFNLMAQVAYLDGRGKMIRDLRIHMEGKPSASLTELWMQEQVSAVQTDAAEADRLSEASNAASKAGDLGEYLKAAEAAVVSFQRIKGRVDELILVDQNLNTYFRGKSEQDEARRLSRARILGALGAALQTSSAPPPFPVQTRCQTYGNTTNCTSR